MIYRPLPTGTKLAILELLVKQDLSATELSQRLDMTPAAVRQHLASLHATGWLDRRRQPGGAQRPTEVYFLTDSARAAFPKQYALLLRHLADAIESRGGPEGLALAIEAAARSLADEMRADIDAPTAAERWQQLTAWLEDAFGWQAEVASADHGYRLLIHRCPFQEVSMVRPQVCGIFFGTLIRALYADVTVEHQPGLERPPCCALLVHGETGSG